MGSCSRLRLRAPPKNVYCSTKNMKQSSQPIEAYCTVDPARLTKVEDEYFCQKCSKTLVNSALESNSERVRFARAGKLICGFTSAIALAGCGTNNADLPLPGIYYSPEELDLRIEDYPAAKPLKGKVGVVASPYGGHLVDISRLPAGSLVIDPNYPAESKKLFRI